jgi:stage III sporulation protein AB
MKALGFVLVTAAGLLLGLWGAERLAVRQRRCQQLCSMLERLAFELARFQTPLPQLFEALASQLEGFCGQLCQKTTEALAVPMSFSQAWEQALSVCDRSERTLLEPLGGVLGRYGSAEQLQAVERCRHSLEQALAEAAQQRREKGRLYVTLSTVGGLLAAVLLL